MKDSVSDFERRDIEEIVHKVFSDGKVLSIVFFNRCGCYSEYTTDPCSLRVEVEAKCDVGDYKSRDYLEHKIEQYAEANLDYDGCSCCDESISVNACITSPAKGSKS